MTPYEYDCKLRGFSKLEEHRREGLLLAAYYSSYGVQPRGKGQKAMKPDKFLLQFASEERSREIHKAKINKIKKITENK